MSFCRQDGGEPDKNRGMEGRIVHGYTPASNRGPLVLLHVHNKLFEHVNTCTGSVLNDRFVITAAHCACFNRELRPGYVDPKQFLIMEALFLDTFAVVFTTLLHASTMSQMIPDIHGYSQIFPVSEGMSF